MKRFFHGVGAGWRSVALLLLAGAAGVLAAWSAGRHIQGRLELIEQQARVPTVDRLVADEDLAEGTRLHAGVLAVRSFPEEWVSADALLAEDVDAVVGRELAYPVRRGQAIVPAHLAGPRPQTLSARLGAGRRAVTVPVGDLNVQASLLSPGDRLDIYASFERNGTSMTAPLLQAVRVIATGNWQDAAPPEEARDYATVTFDLAPGDAVKLLAARQAAELTAMLRHPDDASTGAIAARGDVGALLGLPAPPRPRPAPVILYGDASGASPDPDIEDEAGAMPGGLFVARGGVAARNDPLSSHAQAGMRR